MSSELDRLKAALADRYEIDREIGAGGMATVYLATDLRHERQVALKVLRPDLAESLGPKRFLQEVRVTANLQHPHILPLFDSGSADGFLFYVMPFIEGESLRERLTREGELPVPEAARLLRDVVDALSTAHEAGVVHRDIKPENVLISGRHALVADFGVAKAVTEATGRHQLTTMGVALGTPYYMAPEQAAADTNIDHRVDIYAIGAMAYELLAGRPPFTGPSPQAVLTAQVTKKPDPLSEHRASVPAALEQLIMRCLEKKAADRWQTAEEMLPYLEAAATPSGGMTPTGMQPVTVPTSPLGRLPKWAVPAGVVGVVAVAGVWALGGGWGMRGEPTDTSATASAAGAAASDAAAALDSLRVVVLPFENRTGDGAADVWGDLVAEEATRRLTQGASYLDVPTQGAVRAAGLTSGADPAAAARSLGARYVVSGRYSPIGDRVRFDADVTDAVTGQLATAIDPITVGHGAIQESVEVVSERAAVAAAAYARPNPGSLSLRGVHPPSTFESLDRYFSAGEAFCRNEYDQVLAVLEDLIESDPAFISARLMALPTHSNGGRGRLSRDSLLALARAALPRMTRIERLNYTWVTSESEEERLGAAEEMDGFGVWDMAAYAVAFSALRLNRIGTAVEAVERIPYEDACYYQWPALWSMRVTAHHLVGNHETELEHAREAVRRFPRSVGRAGQLGVAAAATGRLAVADSAVERLVALPADADGIVNQLVVVGHELAAHGHAGRAARVYARAYEMAQRRSAPDSPARANAAVWALAPAEALPVVEAAAAAAPENANAQGLLGTTLARLGRTEEAMAAAERSFELSPTGRWPVVVAAVAEGPGSAVEAMRRTLDAGGIYFHVGNLFLHYMPPLVEIADDPTWKALVAPR